MARTLAAIQSHPRLSLQLLVTGMHLRSELGRTIDAIKSAGWKIDATIDWPSGCGVAEAVGVATAGIARALRALRSEIVLVTGDRPEALAAATAGQLSRRLVAHVHGGDRALGQSDDAIRHAISKLAHLHLPATRQSAQRLRRMGEPAWRVKRVGSPGIDGIARDAAPWSEICRHFDDLQRKRFALLIWHPTRDDDATEREVASQVLSATLAGGVPRVVVVYPNNDPGFAGVVTAWKQAQRDPRVHTRVNLPRELFLGLLRESAVVVGNSSSGIIEASSLGTMSIDIGLRQQGRERGSGVIGVSESPRAIRAAVARVWNEGQPQRARGNVYAGRHTSRRIAELLAGVEIDERWLRKLNAY